MRYVDRRPLPAIEHETLHVSHHSHNGRGLFRWPAQPDVLSQRLRRGKVTAHEFGAHDGYLGGLNVIVSRKIPAADERNSHGVKGGGGCDLKIPRLQFAGRTLTSAFDQKFLR